MEKWLIQKGFIRQVVLPLFLLSALSCFSQQDKPGNVISGPDTLHPFKSISTAANPDLKGNGIKRLLIGKNYRKEWTQPVLVPVINLQKEGLEPKKEGGGKETKSLHLEDNTGKEWVLRSVKKYPDKALPREFKNTVAAEIVADDISASYPFGALSMGILSHAAKVPFLRDSLVYLGDDPALGKFREKYRNHLMLWEEKQPTYFPVTGDKKKKDLSTEELVYKLQENNNNQVNQLAVLRARLLDNFVMDFDRHEGQWNWIGMEDGKLNIYYPVPKDRDQVFYTNQGLLPKIMRSKGLLPELAGFQARVKHIKYFNRAARNFDRAFLTSLTEDDWRRETDSFLQSMTDSVIELALAQQPGEIRSFNTQKIIQALKEKRKYFRKDMMRYYQALSSAVSITGSNKDEEFLVSNREDGKTLVEVNHLDSLGRSEYKIYSRVFDPKITKEIRLYGLEGNDRFNIVGTGSAIKVRMIGGPGKDTFTNNSQDKKIFAYDVNVEDNKTGKGIHDRISNDPLNNTYTRLGFNDNLAGLGPTGEISPKNGILLGLQYKLLRQGFRKEPFASRHVVSVMHSINSSSFHFKYDGDIMQVAGKTDLLLRGDLMLPTKSTNFLGLGNETSIESINREHNYYHTRYDIGSLSVMGKTNISRSVNLQYGPVFRYIHLRQKENENKFVTDYYPYAVYGDVYHKKFYGGGELALSVNRKNNELMPTCGYELYAYTRVLAGLNATAHKYAQSGGRFSFYTDFTSSGTLVFASLFGLDHNSGDYEFEQAQYLGFSDHLRGYIVQRFAGRTAAYNNTELRVKLASINAVLFPAVVGLYGFNDVGRVWNDKEQSRTWHHGYGGGIWVVPFNKLVVTGYLSFSKEEKALPWATIGYVF